jgi:hypothetical protein
MIVYNVTIKIGLEVAEEWLQWQMEEHIPDIMATGKFVEWKMFRLLEQDESDGITYVFQYFANSPEDFQSYADNDAPLLRARALERWGDQFVAFRTIMQLVN